MDTIYVRPNTTITLIIQPGSILDQKTLHLDATPITTEGRAAILLTLNQTSSEPHLVNGPYVV